eukprot:363649-Chlamydomonas_euryale.AAC.4
MPHALPSPAPAVPHPLRRGVIRALGNVGPHAAAQFHARGNPAVPCAYRCRVIRALGDAGTRAHAPFRESKLTRLLAPYLAGNGLVSIVCTLSPSRGAQDGWLALGGRRGGAISWCRSCEFCCPAGVIRTAGWLGRGGAKWADHWLRLDPLSDLLQFRVYGSCLTQTQPNTRNDAEDPPPTHHHRSRRRRRVSAADVDAALCRLPHPLECHVML